MRTLGTLIALVGLALPASASAQDTRMLKLLSAGNYADAAAQYLQMYERDKDPDDLFNAAFYSQRAGTDEKGKSLAERYLTTTKCRENENATPRRVRHCALAAELAGDLPGALALFQKYRSVARLWVHRSRADGGIERVKLKQELAALEASHAKLKARCSAPPAP